MNLCYIDESGTPDVPGNTSHYVLAGLSIPDHFWKRHHEEVEAVKDEYGLTQSEIHVAWMMRPYVEQNGIQDFASMTWTERRSLVRSARTRELLRIQTDRKRYKQTRKNYRQTENYTHLTFDDRRQVVRELAECISRWGVVRLFAECIDKVHFDPMRAGQTVDEQAFEQVVSRFEQFLSNTQRGYGLLIHDNNQTVARRHTEMMKRFLERGTLWTQVENIIETPLFVDSQLTGMVQLADLCAYALRRYVENGETELFDPVFQRADTRFGAVVGVRHFTNPAVSCQCKICAAHAPSHVVLP